ncbi:MAG: hypothetical protein ACLS4X_02875, partial [Ruminococcus callidus]
FACNLPKKSDDASYARALCSVSFILCGFFHARQKAERMIDMADQELFMIQDDTDEAYAKEHAEELAAESKKHEKWFEDYIEKEKNKRNV